MLLRILQERIKGSKLWEQSGFRRLYFHTGHTNRNVQVKSWIEMTENGMDVRVTVSCTAGSFSKNWCKVEASRIRAFHREQFRELVPEGEELSALQMKAASFLKDDTPPVHSGSMPHQTEALEFLCTLKVAALFGDAGIGKTKPAIDLANSRYLYGKIQKVLVLCSCSTIVDFMNQVDKWLPHSTLEWRYIGIESIGHSDNRFQEAMEYVYGDTMIIIDESHLVKSPTALRSLRAQQLCDKSSYKLILSSMPVTENPGNLYMQYTLLHQRITGHNNWPEFARQFVLLGGVNMGEVIGYKNLDYLTSLIAPYTYQMKKENCLIMPSKTFYSKVCDLTELQRFHYQRKKKQLLHTINQDEITPGMMVKYLTELQQIACGFHYIDGQGYRYLGSQKLSMLERMQLKGQVIFFCKYLFEVDMLIEWLGAENCACFTGLNRNHRDREKQLFVNGEKRYFVATIGSGGSGLDGLAVSNTMVFLSKPFRNLVSQCIASMDRPGQNRQMFIYDIKTNTGIDRLIDKAISRKMGLEQEISNLLSDKTTLRQYAETL